MRKLRLVLPTVLAAVLAGNFLSPLQAGESAARPKTVGELFGFAADERLLVIHADDAGMCHAHNRATIDGMERGAINSASVMMPCPWVLEIIQYAKSHPDADFGIHATLTSEWKLYRWRPVAPWDRVKTLLDAEGFLHRGVLETAVAASAAEVETELRAQIQRALDMGLRPTHLDTHMGTVYARPDYFAAYRKVASEFGLPCMIPRLTEEEREKLSPPLRVVAAQIGQALFEQGEVTLDHLNGGYSGSGGLEEQTNYYRETIRNLRPGINQIILHPACDGDELSAITGSHARRDNDWRIFANPAMVQFLRDQKVRLITWREIGQRQAAYRKRLTKSP